MKLEIQQGNNLAGAAKETGVNLSIWSSLLNVNKREYNYREGPWHISLTHGHSHKQQAFQRVLFRFLGHG